MITIWAKKHGVSELAVQELLTMLNASTEVVPKSRGTEGSEASVQVTLRLNASRSGIRLWRNNVGATYTPDGGFIRYGLCNESARMNSTIKSSDLIGIRPITVTQNHVGCKIGQLVAREVKRPNWHYTGTKRERAQLNFLTMVALLGGDARFANTGDDI